MLFQTKQTCPKREYWRLPVLAITALSLNACSWVGAAAKEGSLSLTERRGLQSFTFAGELPPEFGLNVTTWYGPVNPEQINCQTDNLYNNRTQNRTLAKTFESPFKASAQSFNFTVPLNYHVGLCELQLGRIKLEINGRYGQQVWQKTYDDGGFFVVDKLPPKQPAFPTDGTLHITAQCEWLFQESKLRLELSKLLNCKGAGAYLQRDQLPGKTVNLAIEVNPEERPYYRNTWIKFPEGWKPCLPKEGGWIKCQNPALFKTFQMNGQTCTVYPNCTE